MSKTQTKIRVSIQDVNEHGTVAAAIAHIVTERCGEILVADSSAMGGQTFATSGPGPGWTKRFSVADYARVAIAEDVAHSGCKPSDSTVIDPEDGIIGHGVDEFDEDGNWTGKLAWEDESCIELVVPDQFDAAKYPAALATMADEAKGHANAFEWTEERNEYSVTTYADRKHVGTVELSMFQFAEYVAAAQWPQGIIELAMLPSTPVLSGEPISEEMIDENPTVYLE